MRSLNHWSGRLVKIALIAALVVGIALVGIGRQTHVLAQDGPQVFVIQAGGFGPQNIELMKFSPTTLQVHRGDTVVWDIFSFHNIHFNDQPTEYVIFQEVDGETIPVANPAVVLPTIESGATYSGGDANSGLPDVTQSIQFSVVIDLEPGVYAYLCDVHPGMLGTIEVVEDDVAIPSPQDVTVQAFLEIQGSIGEGLGAAIAADQAPPAEGTEHTVMMGAAIGRATSQMFYPQHLTIAAGDTVTWFIPEDSNDGHLANWPPTPPEGFATVIEVEDGPPIVAIGEGLLPAGPTGFEVGADGLFNTGILFPGQSYSVVFTEPGTYRYVCSIHPGMNGSVVVTE
jgi:plastocyanin